MNKFDKLNDLVIAEKGKFEVAAKEWDKNQKRDKVIYTIGSGINYGEIYSIAACWLMEMQWINFNTIHSGEFFHDPFEITDRDVPFILVRSTGDTRFLGQRVEDFTKKFSSKLMVLGQTDFDLESIDSVAKEYIATVFSDVVICQMVGVIAFERGHFLDVRRYMWQMKY